MHVLPAANEEHTTAASPLLCNSLSATWLMRASLAVSHIACSLALFGPTTGSPSVHVCLNMLLFAVTCLELACIAYILATRWTLWFIGFAALCTLASQGHEEGGSKAAIRTARQGGWRKVDHGKGKRAGQIHLFSHSTEARCRLSRDKGMEQGWPWKKETGIELLL